jgi:6-phosphogluconolactonase
MASIGFPYRIKPKQLKDMHMHIYKTERELAEAYADYFIELAGQSISDRGVFNVVLAGGGSPKQLYTILASEYRDKVSRS